MNNCLEALSKIFVNNCTYSQVYILPHKKQKYVLLNFSKFCLEFFLTLSMYIFNNTSLVKVQCDLNYEEDTDFSPSIMRVGLMANWQRSMNLY